MANPKIEVEVGADVSGLKSGAEGVDRILNGVGSSAAKSAKTVKTGFSSANAAAMEFSRIIQDAPYAMNNFGSIANNITRGLELVGSTAIQTGSKVAAFKVIISSLLSPVNLVMLGVSAATSAFTAYQMGLFDSGKETKDLKSETELLNEQLDKLKKNLGAVARAHLEAASNANEELAVLNLLKSVADNAAESTENRLTALSRIKDLYPSFNANIDDEKTLVSDLTTEYEKLIKAITEKARLMAIEDQVIKLAKEEIDLRKQLTKAESDAFLIQKERLKAEAQLRREQELIDSGEVKGSKRLNAALKEVEAYKELAQTAENSYNLINGKLSENRKAVTELTGEYGSLSQSIVEALNPSTSGDDKAKKELEKRFQKYASMWDSFMEDFKNRENQLAFTAELKLDAIKKVDEISSQILSEIEQDVKKSGQTLSFDGLTIEVPPNLINPIELPPIDETQFLESVSAADQAIIDANSRFVESARQMKDQFIGALQGISLDFLVSAISDGMFAVGEALTSGGNAAKEFGKVLLSSLSNFLKQLGEQMVAYGTAALAMAVLTQALSNPYTAIPAAIGLIAAGAALALAAGAIQGTLKSGGSSSGGSSGVASGSSFLGTTNDTFSANQSISLSGDWRIDGKDLVYIIDRNTESKN